MFDEEKKDEETTPEIAAEAAAGEDADLSSDAGGDESLFFDLSDEESGAAEASSVTVAPGSEGSTGEFSEEDELLAALEIDITEEEKAEMERRSNMNWYVIHANTGHENKVKRNIEMAIKTLSMEDSFGEILVATQEVTEMKNGKRSTVKRKFFPSYILVEMIMNKETHHFINGISGVTRFIGGTTLKPEPISQDEVDRILGRISEPDEARQSVDIPYEVGDSVQVIDGPFTEWIGVINEINHDKGKLKVMISIFGSETPVELDFLQVKAV